MGAVYEFGIQCNVRAPHRFMRFGALCTIVNTNPGNAGEHLEVVGMSRGGKVARTWMDARDLSNYRAKWLPDREDSDLWIGARCYATKEDAQARADFFQNRYGDTPMRDLRPDKEGR